MTIPILPAEQEWKAGNHTTLGKVRAFEANPPQAPQSAGVDPLKYPLRLIKLEMDPNPAAKGWAKVKLSIPPATRARHADCPIYGPSWNDLILDFDKRPLVLA